MSNDPALSTSWQDALELHLPCLSLHGETPYGRQSCRCEPQEKWPGCHVSRAADLCALCARGLAGGVVRWSWLACDDCRTVERALSGWLGIPVLPLGRHSVMNGVILADDAPSEVDKEEFAAALTGLARGWARLKNWGHAEAMGLACRLATDDEQVRVEAWQRRFAPSARASVDAIERLLETPLPEGLRVKGLLPPSA